MPSAPKGTALERQSVRVVPIRDKTTCEHSTMGPITVPSVGSRRFFKKFVLILMKDLPSPREDE